MSTRSRYRLESGQPCIDIKIGRNEQLFDTRDPAPFRERDLDPGLVDYLLAGGEDLVGAQAFRVVFWLEHACPPGEIEQAFRAHFADMLDRLRRRRRQHRRTGQVALLIAFILIVALMALGRLIGSVMPGSLGSGLKEGLLISSWVVMWRPVEILIYDWIPVWQDRRVVSSLLEAPIDVRVGRGPDDAEAS